MITSNTQPYERSIQPLPNSQLAGSSMARPSTTGKNSLSGLPIRKALVTIALAVMVISSTYAQVDEKRHFLALMGGASVPMGQYGSTTGSNPGYAQIGSSFSIESAYMFTKNVGIGASFGSFSNAMDADKVLTVFNREAASEGLSGNSSLTPSRSYGNTYLFVGPNFSFPFTKSTVDLRVGVGSVTTNLPAIAYKISDETYAYKMDVKESSGSAFGYSIGIGSRFNLSTRWAVRVAGDFISTETEVQSQLTSTYTDSEETLSLSESIKEKNPVSAYNFSLGIAYQFVK